MSEQEIALMARKFSVEFSVNRALSVMDEQARRFIDGQPCLDVVFNAISPRELRICETRLREAYNAGVHAAWVAVDRRTNDLPSNSKIRRESEGASGDINALTLPEPPK